MFGTVNSESVVRRIEINGVTLAVQIDGLRGAVTAESCRKR